MSISTQYGTFIIQFGTRALLSILSGMRKVLDWLSAIDRGCVETYWNSEHVHRSAVSTPLIIRRDPTCLCVEQPCKRGFGLFRDL